MWLSTIKLARDWWRSTKIKLQKLQEGLRHLITLAMSFCTTWLSLDAGWWICLYTYVCIYIYCVYIYIYIVFPNRIENDRNGNSSNCIRRPGPFAMQLALRLCFCLMPIASISTSSQKIRNAVVVSHVKIHPTRQSVKLARGKSERLRWDKNHCIRKSAATTWLQRTLGGVIVGLTTLWIARYNMGVCLVIQKSPEKIEMGKSLPHW